MPDRLALWHQLIPGDISQLWCPPITHYTASGDIDVERMAAHWAWMRPNVKAFLVPGSTSDGWELTDARAEALLMHAVDLAQQLDAYLLVGVLKAETSAMLASMTRIITWLQAQAAQNHPLMALQHMRVIGFAVCAPRGAEQAHIQNDLESLLHVGVPIALYQLPHVTHNEIAPETVQYLAERYPNLLLFKDSSGDDRVAQADHSYNGVFLLRGAEGDYYRWLAGPYHGLLLSTANSFPQPLGSMIRALQTGDHTTAMARSEQLTGLVNTMFTLAATLPTGNAFVNANKALDHFMAYGPEAERIAPPYLYTGETLPPAMLAKTGQILLAAGLLPNQGYLD